MLRRMISWYKNPHKSPFENALIILLIAFLVRTFGFGLYQVPSGSMETTMLVGGRFISDKLTVWFQPIKHGDIICFNDPTYTYSKNPVINLFQRYVYGPTNWTKRAIGLPGDHIQGKIEDGKTVIYRNGQKIDEPYIDQYPLIYVWKNKKPTVQDRYLGNYEVDVYSFDPSVSYDKQPFYKINPDLIVDGQRDFDDYRYDAVHKWGLSLPREPLHNGNDVFDVQLGKNQYWAIGDNRKGSYDSRAWGTLDGTLIHGKIKFCLFSVDGKESWFLLDLIKHPIDFWKRVHWSRCMRLVY